MDYLQSLLGLFHAANAAISERIKKAEVSFSILLEDESLPIYNDVINTLSVFPSRDEVKIAITDNSDNILYIDSSTTEDKYSSFVEEAGYGETVDISIEISKRIVNNRFSIYNFDSFASDISNLSEEDALAAFSNLLQDLNKLIFVVLDKECLIQTKTMLFVSETNADNVAFNTINRSKKLDLCKSSSYFINSNDYALIPDDFIFEINVQNNPFTILFDKLATLLSLAYISTSSMISDKKINVKISGQRVLDYSYDLENIRINIELIKIYNWIYTDGNPIDKAIIAKNILSLHCRYVEVLDIDAKTMDSIQSNYTLYLKNNVDQYIELKNKLSEFINDVVSRTGDYATEIFDKFKSNLLAIYVFLFTVILANIVSNQPLNNIFTYEITIIFECIILGSLVFLLISLFELSYKIRKIQDSYKLLKDNYSSIFTTHDLNETFDNDKMMSDMLDSINRNRTFFSIMWIVSLLIIYFIVEVISSNPILFSLFR